ncbi:MAG TPA: hypothetical protein DHV28_04445 [Ignavibacteriales bacterium]|nr:hypothetical protein [Ignavibacteriales bacterium]
MRYVNLNLQRWLNSSKRLLITVLIVFMGFPVLAQVAAPSKILLTFSEPMSRESIFDPANYNVIANENVPVEIISVGVVKGDSAVVLFINKKDEWLSFKITVNNLRDKAGNLINAQKNQAEFEVNLAKNTSVTLVGDK